MYTLVFKKGKFEVTFSTDDKEAVARQMELIVRKASEYALSKKQNPDVVPELQNERPDSQNSEPAVDVENKQEENLPEFVPPQEPSQEKFPEYRTESVSLKKSDEPEQKSEPEVHEFVPIKVEVPNVVIPKVEALDVVPTNLDISTTKPVTINSLQNPEPIQEEVPDFDKILNSEMSQPTIENKNIKDEKFINYVEAKSVIERLDFLIATAQYLAQYEGMNTFNLKHINAKLMQNFTIIVDHSILQSAISRGDITKIQQGSDDGSSEYMLTEKGLRTI